MTTIEELYNDVSDIYNDIDYDDYVKNTDALVLFLALIGSKELGDVTCTDPLLRENNGNIFYPSSVSSQTESGDLILCKDVLYSYRNTIREFNKFTDVFGKRRTVSSSTDDNPNAVVQTIQINSVNITADELNCCISATVDKERYGECEENIKQYSGVSVKISDVDITEFERVFMIQKINNALYEDFENSVSRSTCKTESEKQDIVSNIDMDVDVTIEMEEQFIRVSQINRQNYDIKYLWSWGPCFNINQSNELDIDVNMNKEIVGNITRDVYRQFISRNPSFLEIMNINDDYITTTCSPDCNQDIQHPRCQGGGGVCEGKVDGTTCPGGGVCEGGVCEEDGGEGGGGGISNGVVALIVVGVVLLCIVLAVLFYFRYMRNIDKRDITESGLGIYF